MTTLWLTLIVVIYLFAVGYLGYRGYRTTQTAADFMVAGRKSHPYVMAMSYGATFISTSAIVGFGGAAAVFGMGILWLTFLNIFLGIFIAFTLFGSATHVLGLRLDAHTFPELLGRRFRSRFIQGAAAFIIFAFMPLYASAVLIGAAKFLSSQLTIGFEPALFLFATIIALYVVMGGIKGVMLTDALQGTVMFVGMAILLLMTYSKLGGIGGAHAALTGLAAEVPARLAGGGHQGWTHMPVSGSPLWWTLVSTIVMGVGIGVLAQPQLVVRYMTVKSTRELDRGVPVGGIFILMMTGVAFVVGALSNVWFFQTEGKVAIAAAAGDVDSIIPLYIKGAMPGWFGALFMLTLLSAAMSTVSSQFHVMGTSLGRDIVEQSLRRGRHMGGLSIARIGVLAGILMSVGLSYLLEMEFGKTGTEIIARGTALFFGMCACAFLPMYVGALWSRRITTAGAKWGMIAGAASSLLWMLFVHEKESTSLLLCKALFGVRSLAIRATEVDGQVVETFIRHGKFVWAYVDPLIIGLPLAIVVTIVVSRFSRPLPEAHLARCFERQPAQPGAGD